MSLQVYNQSYQRLLESIDQESENRLSLIRQRCIADFLKRIETGRLEWEKAYSEILRQSREEPIQEPPKPVQSVFAQELLKPKQDLIPVRNEEIEPFKPKEDVISDKLESTPPEESKKVEPTKLKDDVVPSKPKIETIQPIKPEFNNSKCIAEFVKLQDILSHIRESFSQFIGDPSYKPYKNDLNLFIRTQINSISNSDSHHLDTKVRLLSNLFTGQRVTFQDRLIDANQHPQARTYAMDLAAQTFVTVGTRLVNSVPAIAKSMAIVINGIVKNNLPLFQQLIIAHLQERCPYLIPMQPKLEHYSDGQDKEIRFKVACGYNIDPKTQGLESEDKYLLRMRSMALIYSCVLMQCNMGLGWTWLASSLNLDPLPVITATILQAFLQEASKQMSSVYLGQFKKLVTFIREDYIKMVEDATCQTSDRQSFIKLKSFISDDSNVFAMNNKYW